MSANFSQEKKILRHTLLGSICLATLIIVPLQSSYAESKPESNKGTMSRENSLSKDATIHEHTLLDPCPKRPNCVNSQLAGDKKHFIKALQSQETSLKQNRDRLLEALNQLSRVKVVTVNDNYVKAEFTSKWFGFVDDVEFVISASHIDVRSASRTGYSDMGANRRRVEKIRGMLTKK